MIKRGLILLATTVFCFVIINVHGQPSPHHQLIQFSGVVVDKGTLKPIPFTAVMVRSSNHGTICDNNGYFSFVAEPKDTVEFVSVGYVINTYRLPDTLTDRYALIHLMDRDTTNLKAVVVYPWPSKEAFKHAFLSVNIPNDDLDRAKKNLALAQTKAKMEGMPMDAGANYLNTMQAEYNKLYYAGQLPPNNLLNPLAWAQFINAWKSGSLNIQ